MRARRYSSDDLTGPYLRGDPMRSTTRRAAASAALVLSGALLLSACDPGSGGGSGSASGSPTAAGSATAPDASASASPTTAAPDASVSASASSAPSGNSAACSNLVATAAVKAAVTHDYGAAVHRGHITPRPHQFLYGRCDGTTYASSAFDLTPGATYQDQVAAQDEGSTRKYFSLGADGTWTLIGSAGFPDNGGCVAQIPPALAALWGGCRAGTQ